MQHTAATPTIFLLLLFTGLTGRLLGQTFPDYTRETIRRTGVKSVTAYKTDHAGDKDEQKVYTEVFDRRGRVVQKTAYSELYDKTTEFEYHDDTSLRMDKVTVSSRVNLHEREYIYEYNAQDRLVRMRSTKNKVYTVTYKYDEAGNVIEEQKPDYYIKRDFNDNGYVRRMEDTAYIFRYKYDGAGNRTMQERVEKATQAYSKTQTTYDEQNRVEAEDFYRDHPVYRAPYRFYWTRYLYDSSDRLIRKASGLYSDTVRFMTRYEYDDSGRIEKEFVRGTVHAYEYNKRGNLVKYVHYRPKTFGRDEIKERRYEYTYFE